MVKKVFPWSLNAEIPSDGSRLRIGWVSITQHRPDDVHNIEAFPDRGHDRAAGHVLAQDGVEMPGRELLVMLLHELLSRKDKLRGYQFEAPLFEPLQNLSDDAALDTVGLDHDKGSLLAGVGGQFCSSKYVRCK